MQPLDRYTYKRVHQCLDEAKRQGTDAAEYLHRYGLIASKQLRDQTRGDMVRDLRERLHQLGAVMPPSFWAALEEWEADARRGDWR